MVFFARFERYHAAQVTLGAHQDLRHSSALGRFAVGGRNVYFISEWPGKHAGRDDKYLPFIFKKPAPEVADIYTAFGTVELENKLKRGFIILIKPGIIEPDTAPAQHKTAVGVGR